MSGRPRVEPTEENIERFFIAQLKCAKEHMESWIEGYRSDDGYDYLTSAMDLAHAMTDIFYDSDKDRFDALMNTEIPEHYQYTERSAAIWNQKVADFEEDWHVIHLTQFACDGVANEFYEEAPALYEPEED